MSHAALRSRRILLVEDEPIVGLELACMLKGVGAEVIGPARTLSAGLALAMNGNISAALLDVSLGDETVFPVAQMLCNRGVPFAFLTGHASIHDLQSAWPTSEVIAKPASRVLILATLTRLLERLAVWRDHTDARAVE
jgi:DNA-binding response OmpR family regulator